MAALTRSRPVRRAHVRMRHRPVFGARGRRRVPAVVSRGPVSESATRIRPVTGPAIRPPRKRITISCPCCCRRPRAEGRKSIGTLTRRHVRGPAMCAPSATATRARPGHARGRSGARASAAAERKTGYCSGWTNHDPRLGWMQRPRLGFGRRPGQAAAASPSLTRCRAPYGCGALE